jgi:hypothetical protein
MAYKLILTIPWHGMSFIWNISHHVGDALTCQNASTDVDLTKILIAEWIRVIRPTIHASCKEPFRVNGRMDIHTAYWIRVLNAQHSPRLSFKEEGILSPARFGSSTWTIARLNVTLKNHAPDVWNNLPNHRSTNAALRAALGRTSS